MNVNDRENLLKDHFSKYVHTTQDCDFGVKRGHIDEENIAYYLAVTRGN